MNKFNQLSDNIIQASTNVMILGILMAALGVASLASPETAGNITAGAIGAFLFLGGVLRLFAAAVSVSWKTLAVTVFYGLIMSAAGIWAMANPEMGLEILTLLVAAYLVIDRELSGEDTLISWINQRMATESVLEALNLDFSVNYAFHDNWQLRVGLGYTQINTSFTYEYTSTKTDSIEGLQMLIFNVDNTVDSIYGPIGSYETKQRQLEIYNSFRQIELPILANYETRWGDLSLIFEAGARFRLNRTWEGQIIGDDGEVASLEDQTWYRNGLGVNLQAGLQLGYTLNDQLQARLGGTVRYSPTNFTNEDAGFDERYQLTGLQLGLRYHF